MEEEKNTGLIIGFVLFLAAAISMAVSMFIENFIVLGLSMGGLILAVGLMIYTTKDIKEEEK